MSRQPVSDDAPASFPAVRAAPAVLLAVSLCHLLNDIVQSLLAAVYPLLKAEFDISFWQVGLLTLVFNITASPLQPAIGLYTDKRPLPYSLAVGMGVSLLGVLLLAFAPTYGLLVLGATLIGVGSAIFHPEASRVTRLASGGRYGRAQSVFQVGGNLGSAIGPLLAAILVAAQGRANIAWFSLLAFAGMVILWKVGSWYSRLQLASVGKPVADAAPAEPSRRVRAAIVILLLLVFTKYSYTASLTSYYTFFVIERFGLTVQQSQVMLFIYLAAAALGIVVGGWLGDWMGSRKVIWFSILGALPFTLMLPYASLAWTGVLSVAIGVILASAFPAIIVYAQEMVPGRVGMIAGLFFGFAFGIGGISAAVIGMFADSWGIEVVFTACSYLPLLGLVTVFLPNTGDTGKARA